MGRARWGVPDGASATAPKRSRSTDAVSGRTRQHLGNMIPEIDPGIRALVRRDAVNGGDVEVAFDAPTREWVAKRSTPTVDGYLFRIREDTGRGTPRSQERSWA
jgi:hypothetical protein